MRHINIDFEQKLHTNAWVCSVPQCELYTYCVKLSEVN